MIQPTLYTQRIVLRPFHPEDAARIQELAGDKAVAENCLGIPHPYPDGMAAQWISNQSELWRDGISATFAIELTAEPALIGAISLMQIASMSTEIGYWIGRPYWNMGYASEAASRVTRFAFEELGIQCLVGQNLVTNPASGAILRKCGFKSLAEKPQVVLRQGQEIELYRYQLLRNWP